MRAITTVKHSLSKARRARKRDDIDELLDFAYIVDERNVLSLVHGFASELGARIVVAEHDYMHLEGFTRALQSGAHYIVYHLIPANPAQVPLTIAFMETSRDEAAGAQASLRVAPGLLVRAPQIHGVSLFALDCAPREFMMLARRNLRSAVNAARKISDLQQINANIRYDMFVGIANEIAERIASEFGDLVARKPKVAVDVYINPTVKAEYDTLGAQGNIKAIKEVRAVVYRAAIFITGRDMLPNLVALLGGAITQDTVTCNVSLVAHTKLGLQRYDEFERMLGERNAPILMRAESVAPITSKMFTPDAMRQEIVRDVIRIVHYHVKEFIENNKKKLQTNNTTLFVHADLYIGASIARAVRELVNIAARALGVRGNSEIVEVRHDTSVRPPVGAAYLSAAHTYLIVFIAEQPHPDAPSNIFATYEITVTLGKGTDKGALVIEDVYLTITNRMVGGAPRRELALERGIVVCTNYNELAKFARRLCEQVCQHIAETCADDGLASYLRFATAE